VYLFDGDAAGLRAADRAAEFIDSSLTPEAGRDRVELSVAVLPGGLDPADFIAANGPEGLRTAVEEAVPLLRFSIDRRLERWDLDRPEERARALKEAAEVLAPVKDSLLADDYVTYIAGRLFADISTVKRAVGAARPPAQQRGGEPETAAGEASASPLIDSPQLRTERDLLDLLVRTPRLRPRAYFLLSENLLTDPTHRAIAEGIANASSGVPADALMGDLEEAHPGSASALSGASLGDLVDADADVVERDLVRKLKEFDLKRRIAEGKARLKKGPDSFKDLAEYDELFENTSALQRELEEYRSGVRDVG
jgi:DNA primase